MFARLRGRGGERAHEDLVSRHFAMQAELPPSLRGVEIDALDPFLRSLLFTDGTVTRALAVQTLAPVSVARLGQDHVPLPAGAAAPLEAPAAEESVRRQVEISLGEPPAAVLWAESFMVPDRLPPGFLGLLDSAPDGIGQSLQRVNMESSRELLWFGLEPRPDWVEPDRGGETETLRRLYRIVSNRQPAILISEYFAVERRLGRYHLAGLFSPEPYPETAKGVA